MKIKITNKHFTGKYYSHFDDKCHRCICEEEDLTSPELYPDKMRVSSFYGRPARSGQEDKFYKCVDVSKLQDALLQLDLTQGSISVYDVMLLIQCAPTITIGHIEKQIPMKPSNRDSTTCPHCGSRAKYDHPYEFYCCHCGQRIDWNNGDERT